MAGFLHPYNPQWSSAFERLRQVLSSALEGLDFEIQHVGSTAIPGLAAKPILDIDIILHNKLMLSPVSARLEALGYINRGEQGIAGRFAFRQASDFVPTTASSKLWQAHHLYVCYSDSLALKNHLLFRDALLNDQELAKRYGQLKAALASDAQTSKEVYTKSKTEFILSVLAQAGLEAKELNEIRKTNA